MKSIVCVAVLLHGGAFASLSRADVVQQVADRLEQAAGEGASGVLRISHGDRLLYESGFGSADCTGEERVTSEHVFMIGSITKELTQVLGFVLEEKGYFELDDSVADVLTEFRGPIGKVTLRQLLNHTGGLPDLIDENGSPVAYTVEYDYESVDRAALLERAERVQLLSEPGSNEEYSNLGYQLLAAVYEVVTDNAYPDLLRTHIFAPAAMEHTGFGFSDPLPVADGCRANDARWGNPIDDKMWGDSGPSWNLMGAGGLLSTAESLSQFFAGLGSGVFFESPEQFEQYKSSRMSYSSRRQQRVMGSAGSNGIFNAVGIWFDDDRFNLILMTNRADHPAEGGLFQDIMKFFPPEYFAAGEDD